MVVVSFLARFTAGQRAVLCSPLKGNWATTDPAKRTMAKVDNNMGKGFQPTVWRLYSGPTERPGDNRSVTAVIEPRRPLMTLESRWASASPGI